MTGTPLPRLDGRCSWCGLAMPVPERPQGGGRSRRFCSPGCKQAHWRWVRKPETATPPPVLTDSVTP